MVFLGALMRGMMVDMLENGIDISGASELLNQFGISGKIYPKLSIVSALTGPGAVLLITIPAALYPALKVRKLAPVEAMAHI